MDTLVISKIQIIRKPPVKYLTRNNPARSGLPDAYKWNKMKKYLIFLVVFIPACSFGQEVLTFNNLIKSKWTQTISSECKNNIIFNKDSTYVHYYCEISEKFYGVFSLRNDTIFLHQKKGEFDNDFPIKSEHRSKPEDIILLCIGGKLIFNYELSDFKNSKIEPFIRECK